MAHSQHNNGNHLRYGMLIPLALMIASFVSCSISYSTARRNLADDLNKAIIALANDNCQLWARQDTISALRQMHEATRKPLIYKASDLNFRHTALKDNAYFTLALVDKNATTMPEIQGHKIISDSIMIIPEQAGDGCAIRLQGFADCSLAAVFASSDQTLPGVLLSLSMLSMAGMLLWRRKADPEPACVLESVKLTPMQRQLAEILMNAPARKVDKATLCSALWGNKINAEESLYTLVKRTKQALANAGITIICNRGESYELRINP